MDIYMTENLKQMTRKELRDYMLKNRNDDEKIRAAISESTSRPGWTRVPADADLDAVFKLVLERDRQTDK